jgi:hypothetical protein
MSSGIKIGLEIWKLLREQAQKTDNPNLAAKLSTPDERATLIIAADMQREEVEDQIKKAFAQTS